MKEFKYRTVFSSVIKTIPDIEKDKYLARASLNQLKKFFPNIDLEKNFDVLPISMSLFNVNLFNKNSDGVGTKEALAFYKSFMYKGIDLEHDRKSFIGVFLNAHLTDYETNQELTEEEAAKMTKPFNCTYGGLLWRISNPKVVDLVEESADPNSDVFQKVFGSFEVAFDDYEIVAIKGSSRNFEDGKVINDPEEIKKLDSKLVCNGGTGILEDNTRIYRKILGNLIGLAGAITQNPAASLPPVVVETEEVKNIKVVSDKSKSSSNVEVLELAANTENISQNKKESVNNNDLQKNNKKIMKITKLSEITNDLLKTIEANVVVDFINESILDKDKEWKTKVEEKANEKSEVEKKFTSLSTDYDTLKKNMEAVQSELKKMQEDAAAQEKNKKFQERMAAFDDIYELSDEDRVVIKDQIQNVDDEQFKKVDASLKVLLKDKNKEHKKQLAEAAEKAKKELEDKNKQTATAATSTTQAVDDPNKVIGDALDNGTKTKDGIPNASTATQLSMFDKYKEAFKPENCIAASRNRKI